MRIKEFDPHVLQYLIERDQFWEEAIDKIPHISFPSYWDIKIVPPIVKADARFHVKHMFGHVSVYLDLDCALGAMYGEDGEPTPYWEIYPDKHGDNARFLFGEEFEMIEAISCSLAIQNVRKIEEPK